MTTRIFILALAIFTSMVGFAQEPGSDAVFQEQTKEYTLNKDGSWTYHYSHKLLINTYFAFHNLYGEDFIIYDPQFQKLKVNQSVTTMADGKKVATPENAYNDLLPGFAANVPAWNRLREMVVTHTALERGSTIDFDYILSTAKGYSPSLMGNEQLLMNSPVKKLTFKISVPAGGTLNVEQYNITAKPTVTKQNGFTTYTWILNDLPATLREDFRPREQQNRPRIVFVAGTKATDPMLSFAMQDAFKCEANADIKQAAAEAVKGIDKPLLKALKLQEKVVSEINNWQVPLQYTGYKIQNSAATWKSNGGNEAEKVVLLAAMIKSVNIQAEPVAVVSERFYAKKTASPAIIDRTLVKVSIQGMDPIYLSATQFEQQDLKFQLAGKRIISLVPGKKLESEVLPEVNNPLSVSGNLTLDPSLTLAGNLSLEIGGRLNPWLRMQKDTAFATGFLSGVLGSGKATRVVKGKTDTDLSSFGYNYSAASFAGETGGHVFLKFPSATVGSDSWHMSELVSTRTEPLEIPFPINEAYDLFISIPEGISVITAPAALNLSNEFGSVNIKIAMEGNQLHITRKLNITKTLVPVEKYDAFKAIINGWNSKKYREVVLKRGN
jgi:hypothetical protein